MTGLRECRPGGSCPQCNPPPVYCQTCLEVKVEDANEPCGACARAAEEERVMDEKRIEAMKARLAQIDGEERRLSDERYTLHVAIEEAEGRPESKRARFARAALAHDLLAMDRICAENAADRYRRTGKWDEHQAAAEEILRAESEAEAGH